MATSIGKLSKSFFVKVLVGIIILPFVFWGMGDVFRGGNQNVIATIESKKISTQEFVTYLNRLNLDQDEIKNIQKTNLIDKILSEYIGRKVMALEIEKLGITISDNSLRDIIINDKLFFKDGKFSRTEYEKFLLGSGVTAPAFEQNIIEQESRRQFLGFLAGGIVVPDSIVEKEFKKENQTKTIKYIDLEKYHSSKKVSQKRIKEIYDKNKELFVEEFKSIQYAEITPQAISGNNEYNESFFKQLDSLENNILDGQSFNEASRENNLVVISINKIDANKKDDKSKKIEKIPDNIFKKVFTIKKEKSPEVLKIDNKYFLAEIKSIQRKSKPMDHPDVLKSINAQIKFQNKIKNNAFIVKEISLGGFDENKMKKFANDNNLEVKGYKLENIKQNDVFSEGIIKRIFLTKEGQVDLITNSQLTKNFLILPIKTEYKALQKDSNDFEKYEAKARLNLINKIYSAFDNNLNSKYKVELNRKTINRVKNSF